MTIPVFEGFTSEMATVSNVRLHYQRGGAADGPPVLLWHGFLGTSQSWRKVAPALARAGYSVLVPDMRGYGDSDKPSGVEGYDARALAEEFRALIKQIGFGQGQPLTIVAHDMGAPPALLWAADHPDELAGLLYLEAAPTALPEVLEPIFSFTPEAMKNGSMWWWILPLAPDVPERLIVSHERAFLNWFYQGKAVAVKDAITPADVDEVLRTFSGREGVTGAQGVYRAIFTTMDQTEPLLRDKIRVPIVALGGDKGQGALVMESVKKIASNVEGGVIENCGHFMPEEQPAEVVRRVQAMTPIRTA